MKTAIILAAGRGERLQPLTRQIPKALCPINHIPIIERHIINLIEAKFTKIFINHAYLGDQIKRYLETNQRFGNILHYLPEPPGALETGGAIYNALTHHSKITEPFIVINADIITDYPLTELKLPTSSLAHLILTTTPEHKNHGDFGLNRDHHITLDPHYTFTGIACYHPQAFKNCYFGRYSIMPLLKTLISRQKLTGELYSKLWLDIGTLQQLNKAQNYNDIKN